MLQSPTNDRRPQPSMLQILYRGNAPSTEGMTSAAARAARSPSVTGTTIRTNASSLRCLSAASSGSSSAEVYEHRGRSQRRRTLFFKRSLMNPLRYGLLVRWLAPSPWAGLLALPALGLLAPGDVWALWALGLAAL